MKLTTKQTTIILTASLVIPSTAFTTSPTTGLTRHGKVSSQGYTQRQQGPAFRRHAADQLLSPRLSKEADDRDDEIERLKRAAAQLRAEAASLESEQRAAMAQAAERAFQKFDTNNDGEVSVEELKAGLEKAFKTELPQKRVEQLMKAFDASGDGALQLDEMVTVDKFRNKLDALVREEKESARAEEKRALEERKALELMQAGLEIINDREPTGQEKVISVLPYLFPLLDSLQFAGPLVIENSDNPIAQAVAVVYALYRSIPFGGFIAFFALNFLSGNPTINRLIRYNMQQAIFLDIALFFPALVGAIFGLLGSAVGVSFSPEILELGSDALLALALLSVTYASISSLLGITPNKIPLISDAVNKRMPNFEIMNTQGKVLTREEREEVRKQLEKRKEEEEEKKRNGDEKK
eukprot:scaffold768_cov166-Amphora_coffeaeformis.AAC.15